MAGTHPAHSKEAKQWNHVKNVTEWADNPDGCFLSNGRENELFSEDGCHLHTPTPTVSIPKSELEELNKSRDYWQDEARKDASRLSKADEIIWVCHTEGSKSGGWLEDSPLAEQITEYLKEAGK
jgi:hypothetical protein